MCAECCSQRQGSSKAENRDPAHEEFRVKDPGKVQEHNLSVVFRLTWVGFGSVQSLSRVRLLATPWGGQALHKMTVWSPSEPQPISSLLGASPSTTSPQPQHPCGSLGAAVTLLLAGGLEGGWSPRGLCPRCDRGQRLGARGGLGQGPSEAGRASSAQERAAGWGRPTGPLCRVTPSGDAVVTADLRPRSPAL